MRKLVKISHIHVKQINTKSKHYVKEQSIKRVHPEHTGAYLCIRELSDIQVILEEQTTLLQMSWYFTYALRKNSTWELVQLGKERV